MSDLFENNAVLELPDISKIDFIRIDKKYFRVILSNFLLVFLTLLATLIILQMFAFNEIINEYWWIIFLCFFLLFGLIFLYLFLSFPLRMYALRDKDISYKSGLFLKKLTTVPFARIQHVEIDEGLIARMLNLASISVYTAGDSSDDLVIKGLQKEKALQIKEFLSAKVND